MDISPAPWQENRPRLAVVRRVGFVDRALPGLGHKGSSCPDAGLPPALESMPVTCCELQVLQERGQVSSGRRP